MSLTELDPGFIALECGVGILMCVYWVLLMAIRASPYTWREVFHWSKWDWRR